MPADEADDPNVFPFMIGQTFLQLKTPMWSTDIKTSVSGRERRRALWSYPIWKFKVAYDVLRDGPAYRDVDRLFAFFNSMSGMAGRFQFYDHTANAVDNQIFAVGDGTTTTFQLTSSITVGAISCTEPVFALRGAPTVRVNGVETAVSLGALGKVTFSTAPTAGAALSWSGGFFYLCRFATDELDVEQMMLGLWAGNSVEFQTVKP